jgi:CRISPR-associated protein Csm4
MKDYREYTIEIVVKSPLITSFQSDTLFGHICWAIRFLKWKEDNKLDEFLSCYDNQKNPPLLISNGFPKGYLAKPIIPPVTQKELEDIFGKENRIEKSFRIKTIKRINLITKESFKLLQQEVITPSKLFRVLDERYEEIMHLEKERQSIIVQHNTINRLKGKVEAGLYSQEETFFNGDGSSFEIYLVTDYFTLEDLNRIFKYVSIEGFGRDKSMGKGQFTFEIKEGMDIPNSPKPNAFITLSSYIPSENDPTRGYYSIIHKFGKLGGLYAKGISEVYGNPFKIPLIMFSAGSTFFDKNYSQKQIYGSLLNDVHKNKNIRHYGFAFPIGVTVEDKYE